MKAEAIASITPESIGGSGSGERSFASEGSSFVRAAVTEADNSIVSLHVSWQSIALPLVSGLAPLDPPQHAQLRVG